MSKIVASILSGLTIALLMVLVAGPGVDQSLAIEEVVALNYKVILMIGAIISFPIYKIH